MAQDYPVKKEPSGGTEYGNGFKIDNISRKVSFGNTKPGDASKGGAPEFEPHPAKPEQYKTDTLKP